jgi:amino acid adenylation domain-containing protein
VHLEVEPLGDRDLGTVIQAWQQQEASTPFDLASGLLLRARLLQVAADEHVLLINHHHIASDGWSRSILSRDLTALYNAHRNSQPAQLQPLNVLYQDYAVWQRQRLSGTHLQKLHNYWIPQLTGLEPLELPTDHPRPATSSHQGESISFQIEPALLAPFEELCRSEGATLQMGLLALLALLLHRYSRQDDFAIGIPIWGRNHPHLEPLIGFFINTLPIRTRFSKDLSFRELLAQVKTTSINAYDHQELPFEQMVEALNLERDTSRNPLVQVMLQLIELPPASLSDLEGLEVEQVSTSGTSSKLDLSFYLRPSTDQGLNGSITYATELFCGDRIQRLSEHLLTLLASALQSPDAPARSLTLLTETERLLIESWQQGPTIDVPDLCVHQLFEQQVERTPDAIALIFEDQQLSYRELNARANQLAHHLIDLGVGPNIIVAVCLERSVELIVSLLAILKAGGAYLPIDISWPSDRTALVLKQTSSQHIIGEVNASGAIPKGTRVEVIRPDLDTQKPIAIGNPGQEAGSLAYIIFTSGSTGSPKGIEISQRCMSLKCSSVCQEWQLKAGERILGLSSFGFDISLRETLFPLTKGSTSILATEKERKSPSAIATLIRKHQVSRVQATPSLWEELTANDIHVVKQLIAISIGEPLRPDIAAKITEGGRTTLLHLYGTTETPGSTGIRYDDKKIGDISIGKPLQNVIAAVLDNELRCCPIGIPGELHIGGDGLARGYLNNPELTAQKFIPDPFSDDPSARLYKSGDLASWNPDGTLAFHGRIDQQIKLRGFRIEPGEIEANLLAHPDVAQVTVFLRHDDPANPRLIAYWVPQQQCAESPSSDQLRVFLAERLPDYMVPSAFVALEALPLTTNGKLDRKALPAPSFGGDIDQCVEPSTDLERQLHAIWAEVLGHSDFGITDNFFAVGGHSLAAARLAARIEQALGFSPPLAALFQNPSITGLAPLLSESAAADHDRSAAAAIPTALPLVGDWPEGCQVFSASYAQSRLWFLHQLQPDLTAYHLPAFWHLKGELNLNALSQAVSALIERHPTLRSSFQLHGSKVLQLLHPPAPVHLEVEPLGDRDLGTVIQAWQQQEASTPFDLTCGLLLRARLLQVAADEHVLLINHHHIASDGWSRSILTRDLTALYNAHRKSKPAQLQPLNVHYQDYAAWQRQRLSGDHLQRLHDYWIPELTGLEPLELPTDHPRPATPSYRGESHSFQIEPSLLSPFEELCRAEGATLQMGLLALLALLLQRYSRQDDFAIGIPIWGRNHPDLEPLIGFFINTLPIRTRFSADLSFRQLLNQVKTTSIAAYDHQELPFEQMVEALNLERDTSRNPLVQVMLQLIELPPASLSDLDGLEVEQVSASSASSKLDLSFYLRRSADQGLNGSITYATVLFCGDRIQRLCEHLLTLLASALQSPDASARSLRLLPEAERSLIQSWQHGPTIDVPDLCVHQHFEQQVERTPDAIALIFEDQQLSYRELNARANQLAHHMIDLGVGPEVIVAVCLERSVELIVALLAILKAGGAYLPLTLNTPVSRTRKILEDSRAAFVVASHQAGESLSGALPQQTQFFSLTQFGDSPRLGNPCSDAIGLSCLAYVLYTSGTTGSPKGVAVTHRSIARRCAFYPGHWGLGSQSRVLAQSQINFDMATREWLLPLTCGASVVLANEEQVANPSQLADLIVQRDCTHIAATPTKLELLVPLVGLEGRTVTAGGERFTQGLLVKLIRRYPRRIVHSFGPSEVSIACTFHDASSEDLRALSVSLGPPLPDTKLVVLDSSCQPCPIGIPGELHIGGDGLARGYLNNPELTAEKFIPDAFSDDSSARLYKSGDLASWNPDGTLAFHGRIDLQIKLRGFRIEPSEIEANLLAHPAVAQAVVLLRHDDPNNPRLIAYWVADASQPTTAAASSEQLRSFLADRLPDYMVPAAFVELEALPLTINGKLDRKALPAPSFAGDPDQCVEPSTDLERQLHAIWAEVLGHSDFGITDNFFAVGGHSLAAARLVSRIEQAIGSAPSLAALFQNPTIGGLVPLLAGKLRQLQSARGLSGLSPAAPLSGDWPAGCVAYQASFAQARLWFLHQLEPELTAYHLPAVWRLRGDLDVPALQRALEGLIERHSSLRTSYRLEGSEVIQIVHPEAPFALTAEALGEREPEEAIQELLEEEGRTPFDLTAGLLLRARLLRVEDQHQLLLINHHHIASDGWSRSVLARDLVELYNAGRIGRDPGLSPLPVHYQDYATWQRQHLSAERLQELNDYWIGQLRDLNPLELPSDHLRPAMPSYRGQSVRFQIEPALLEPFEDLCRREGATLQMGLLALLALLLQRYSRQDDFAIGVPIWGRNHPDLEPLIGFFVNTLPIRTCFSADLSFRQLLQQVKTTSINAYDHQDLPFEQMVEALNLERDTSRNPLVQVMLQLIELQPPSLSNLDGLAVEPIQSSATASRFELEFFLRRDPDGGLNTTLVYATDLFCADRIQRLASHLLSLLASTLQAPDAPAASLNFLPESERQLIQSWQHGPTIDVPDLCVHQLFEQQVALTPDAIALIFEEQQLTYSQLNARANQLAHHLIDLGVGPDVIVAVCLERSVDLIVALLAILKAGGAYLPLDPSWPQERRTLLLTESGCAVLIAADGAQLLRVPAAATPAPPLRPLAYISYTSGSTGTPKGVAIEHQAILRLVDPINGFRLGNGAAVLQLAPVAFDAATLEIWGPLLHGGTLVLAPAGTPSLAELAACLRRHHITTLWLTAGLFHAMVDAELESLAGVPQVLAGGDVLHPASVHRLLAAFPSGHALINGYGPTENTTFTCCQRLGSDAPLTTAEVPIGTPIANTTVRVLDPSGHPCPIGIPGELHIGGSGLARGYLNNPELTAETFIPDPFSDDPSARLYKSGDLASWNPDGTLAFHSRIDQQIKLRGFRIEPGEIEANLLAHPGVAQAAVVLRHDDPANPRLIAYWVRQQTADDSPSSDQLRSFLSQRLPDYMVPSAFVALETLPLTTNGKLDRKALPAPSFAGALDQCVEPSTDVERQLHAIWAEVLGHSDFGITDNFFAVGGHSLAAARLVSRLAQTIGSAPALAALFHNPTIAGLVQLMQGAVSGLSPSLVTLQPKGERAPLFVIHGWGGTVWGFVDLARALAPDRPVYGLQAPGVEWQRPPQGSVREMAAGYAEQILQMRPEGMIHLVGYSAGGWYAHAVAEALLERGAVVGLFAVMDTNATTQIHRRIGLFLLLERLYSRFGKSVAGLLNLSGEESRFGYLQGRMRALNALLDRYLHIGVEGSMAADDIVGAQGSSDPFVLLLKHSYRPRRLPIKAAIFAPEPSLGRLRFLWRFYARAGVSLYPIFSDHFDFYRPELMDELAAALESALKRVELPSA